MWVKQCHVYIFLPPMTGNGKFIPPVKWYCGMVCYCFTHSLIYLRPRHSSSWHWNMFRFHMLSSCGFASVSHKACFSFMFFFVCAFMFEPALSLWKVSLLWWMALSSRCFAPCCCHLDDVECPCAPCKTFHFLDVPFFVGVSIAWMAVQGFFLRDVLLALSMALLLLAIPSGFMKWRWMKDMKAATPRLEKSICMVVESKHSRWGVLHCHCTYPLVTNIAMENHHV